MAKKASSDAGFDFDEDDDVGARRMPKLRRYNNERKSSSDDNVSKVIVDRREKPVSVVRVEEGSVMISESVGVLQLFQVVRHVKQAHECQESGETQDFNDDLAFVLDGLDALQTFSVRSLR